MTWRSKEKRGEPAHFVPDGEHAECSRLTLADGSPAWPAFKTVAWVTLRRDDHLCGKCMRLVPGSTCQCKDCGVISLDGKKAGK